MAMEKQNADELKARIAELRIIERNRSDLDRKRKQSERSHLFL